MASKATEPLQARSRHTAERVLNAATTLIGERGIDGFSMTAMAAQAGVSVGGVYGRYPDKNAVLRAVKSRVLDDLQTTVQQALDQVPDTVHDAVAAYVETISSTLFGNARLYAFIFVHSADDEELKSLGFAFHDTIRTAYIRKLAAAGVTDQTALATTYEMVVQSLLMRVISLGHSSSKTALYQGFPDPMAYAQTLTDYITAILTSTSKSRTRPSDSSVRRQPPQKRTS